MHPYLYKEIGLKLSQNYYVEPANYVFVYFFLIIHFWKYWYRICYITLRLITLLHRLQFLSDGKTFHFISNEIHLVSKFLRLKNVFRLRWKICFNNKYGTNRLVTNWSVNSHVDKREPISKKNHFRRKIILYRNKKITQYQLEFE